MAITNEEELKEWLQEQPPEVCLAMAYRAAMRVLPMALDLSRFSYSKHLVITSLRAVLTSGVAALRLAPDVSAAAKSADSASAALTSAVPDDRAGSAVHHAADAAGFAAHAVSVDSRAFAEKAENAIEAAANAAYSAAGLETADAADAAAYSDSERDIQSLATSDIPVPKLLRDAVSDHLKDGLSALEAGGPWSFWAEWYARAMAGDPLPWDLQEQIALIPDEIWKAGPEAVAEEIKKLRFQFRTNVAPQLVRDEETDLFRVETDTEPSIDLADFAANRAGQALKAALESVSANIFNSGSYEAVVINGALAGPRTTSLLATGLYDACLGLDANIGDRYPEEIALINLKNALAGIVDEFCEADEVARIRCANMAGYVAPSNEDVLSEDELRAIPDLTASELDTEAREIIESDIERALAEMTRQEAMPRWRRIRLANWMTTISIYWDRTKKGFKEAETLAKMVSKLRVAWRNFGGGGE